MTVNELRKKYLEYFKQKGHKIIPSASLIPENDPTTLFTSSGMQPIMPNLLGEKHPEGNRICDSQKCFRTQDIDEIGDNRHTTFFEMLGNWSLGDYYKEEQIEWMFDFLVKELGLDPNRIYISCYQGNNQLNIPRDEEAAKMWSEQFARKGIEAVIGERIVYYDDSKNWWSRSGEPDQMPVGEPGGTDSEMFWDFDPKGDLRIHQNSQFANEKCHMNCDCGRFIEIGNNVFMEYEKTKDGFRALPKKNIDFGGGLERLVAAKNDDADVFMVDVYDEPRKQIERASGREYHQDEETTRAFRVILDHLRAAAFLIADGALPSNKDQGYFTRRLIRRAVRYGHQIGIEKNFCTTIVASFGNVYKEVYPNITHQVVTEETELEEQKFRTTLSQGLKEMKKFGSKISAKDAFYLYQSFGFPLELINEELGDVVDQAEFDKEFEKHQELSRAGSEDKFKGGLADQGEKTTQHHTGAHLMLEALRRVLGDHVQQKGSNITEKRIRFDFSHSEKLNEEQVDQVEKLVNEAIAADHEVGFEEMSVDEAKKLGATGVFEDRYGDKVKVYKIGDFSLEICGGPHVEQTGGLGKFRITKQQSSSAGVRRIKAVLE
jgi:alanyl-tRNA synthetase